MVTATHLRKNLFHILEGVAQGQDVEVVHKGATLRIVLASRGSRLARLIPRGDSADLSPEVSGWDETSLQEWEAEQKDLLGPANDGKP